MNPQTANTLAVVLSALGVILILAGAFGIMAMNYGLFAGIACFIAAGVFKKLNAAA